MYHDSNDIIWPDLSQDDCGRLVSIEEVEDDDYDDFDDSEFPVEQD